MPHANARHYIDEMTPLQKLPQSSFSKQQLRLARKLATAKRPAAALEKEHVVMVGGDTATESEVSRAKGELRRTNLLGCGSPKSSHVHVLASRRVLAKPGLAAVLEASRMARDGRMGKTGSSFLQVDQDFAWLFQ